MEYTRKTGDIVETYIGTPKEIVELINLQDGVKKVDEIDTESIAKSLARAASLRATSI